MNTRTIASNPATTAMAAASVATVGLLLGCQSYDTRQSRPLTGVEGQTMRTASQEPRAKSSDAIVLGNAEDGVRLIVEPESVSEVRAGEPFLYTVTVRNAGSTSVHGVTLRQIDASNVSIMPAAMREGGSVAGSSGWDIGMLNPGEAREVTVRMIPEDEGRLTACLAVDYQPVICAEVNVVRPELAIDRIAPRQAYICDDITIEYELRNTGTGTTDAVTIIEELPAGLRTADGSNVVRIDSGPVSPGALVRKQVHVRPVEAGEFQSRAAARTSNVTVESQGSTIEILQPALALQLEGPPEEYLDRPIRYTVRVRNVSDDLAKDTVVTMPAPNNVERPTFSGDIQVRGDQFIIGDLGPGEERSFSVTFTGVRPGQVLAQAAATAYCTEAATQSLTTSIRGIAALRVEMYDLVDPVPVGEQTTYLIQLQNQGHAAGLNLRARALLPDALQFVSAEGASEVRADGNTLVFAPIRELAPGQVVEWRVVCRALKVGQVRVELQVESDATQQQIMEIEPTNLY